MTTLSDNVEVKNKIKSELYQCILEMPYKKITVKMLVARLGMSRQNLYRYYVSKDEILLDMLDSTLETTYQIVELNLKEFESNVEMVVLNIQDMIGGKRELINDIMFASNEALVFSHLKSFVRRVVGRILREGDYTSIDHDYMDVVISQYTGSGFYLLKEWAQSSGDVSPEKLRKSMVVYIESLFQAVYDNAHR